jgi:hypothetical protein
MHGTPQPRWFNERVDAEGPHRRNDGDRQASMTKLDPLPARADKVKRGSREASTQTSVIRATCATEDSNTPLAAATVVIATVRLGTKVVSWSTAPRDTIRRWSPIGRLRLLRVPEVFDDPDFIYELKIDGFRGLAFVEKGQCRLISRNGHTFTRWASLRAELAASLR